MIQQKKPIHILLPFLLVPFSAILAAVLRTAALFANYDGTRDYFTRGSVIHQIFLVLLPLLMVAFLVFAVFLRHEQTPTVVSGGLMTLFAVVFLLVTLFVGAIYGFLALRKMDAGSGAMRAFTILASLMALISLPHYVLFLFDRYLGSNLRGILGLAPALCSLFAAMLLYFDNTTQMNQPAKLLSLFAFLLVSCHALFECRLLLGKPVGFLYFFVTASAMVACASASLPNLLYCLLERRELVLSTTLDFFLFAMFFYLLARLLQLLPRPAHGTPRLLRILMNRRAEEEAVEGEEMMTEEEVPVAEEKDEEKA